MGIVHVCISMGVGGMCMCGEVSNWGLCGGSWLRE